MMLFNSFILIILLISGNDAFISPLQPPALSTVPSHYFRSEKNDDNDPPKLTDGALSTILLPVANAIDDATGGWALSYADLSPESDKTPIGRTFLATNLAYTAMGLFLINRGDVWLGTITEMASVASFLYHYTQLARKDAPLVRLALMIDYIVAALCLGTASFYIWLDPSSIPIDGYIACGLAVFFLALSWVWEKGLPYCINHGLWHLLGGYGGSLIGQAHTALAESQIV
mmetsp:Transcript_2407/g.2907  ORF Transcript_2407/g.2907 Transcript_2407/m.2907 type:complete len:230 (-) Transcript_2407:172-861(-)